MTSRKQAECLELPVLGTRSRIWRYGAAAGQSVVLVHGFRGDHHGLEAIAQALVTEAPELTVWVPDLPGFGDTPAIPGSRHDLELYGEWLLAFTAGVREQAPGFAVLGHSFGSLVVAKAQALGMQPAATILANPISAPALAGPQAVMTALAVLYYRLAALLPDQAARALLGNPAIVRVMSECMAKTSDRELRSWIHSQHHRYFSRFASRQTLLEAFEASVSHTITEYAAAFEQPTLLLAGDRDDITPLAAQLALAKRIPDARLRIAPGVGHLIHYEAVEWAAAETIAFLRERCAGVLR